MRSLVSSTDSQPVSEASRLRSVQTFRPTSRRTPSSERSVKTGETWGPSKTNSAKRRNYDADDANLIAHHDFILIILRTSPYSHNCSFHVVRHDLQRFNLRSACHDLLSCYVANLRRSGSTSTLPHPNRPTTVPRTTDKVNLFIFTTDACKTKRRDRNVEVCVCRDA